MMQVSLFDAYWSPLFEIIAFYQIYSEVVFSIVVAALDCLTSSILVHLYSQLCVLKVSIQTLEDRALNAYKKVRIHIKATSKRR